MDINLELESGSFAADQSLPTPSRLGEVWRVEVATLGRVPQLHRSPSPIIAVPVTSHLDTAGVEDLV